MKVFAWRQSLTSGSYFAPDKTDRYQLSMAYDVIHNITRKTQRHEVVQPSGTAIEQHRTTYDWAYVYGGSQPHAPTQIGTQDGGIGPVVGRTFRYDANGNQESWDHDQNGTRRTLVWDDENRRIQGTVYLFEQRVGDGNRYTVPGILISMGSVGWAASLMPLIWGFMLMHITTQLNSLILMGTK